MRNPSLAPSRHLTFAPTSRRSRDQQSFGEQPSPFTSQEAARMARHIVGAGPTTAKELNEAYHKAWARSGASGQLVHDDRQEMQQNAQLARAGAAPVNTQYSTGCGEGQHLGVTGINRRGDLSMARSVDPSEAFASELNAVPTGSPQEALNIYHRHFHTAKTREQREGIERIWTASHGSTL